MAQLALAGAGAFGGHLLVGGGATFLGMSGAQIGWMVGSLLHSQAYGPEGTDTYGPRMNDSVYTGQVEGTDMPILWGGDRIQAKPIWIKTPPTTIVSVQETGGKGGPPSSKHTTFTYLQDWAVSCGEFICEEPPRRVWLNNELVYDASGDNTEVQNSSFSFTWYSGADGSIDSIIEQDVGIGNCPSYKGRPIMVITGLNLTARYGNRLPVVEVELQTTGTKGKNVSDVTIGDDPDPTETYNNIELALRHPVDPIALINPVGGDFDIGDIYYFDLASRTGFLSSQNLTSYSVVSMLWFTDPDLYSQDAATSYIVSEWKDLSQDNYVCQYEYPSGKRIYSEIWNVGTGGVYLIAESQLVILCGDREGNSGCQLATKIPLAVGTSYSFNTIASDTGLNTNKTRNAECIDYFGNKFGFLAVSDTNSELAYWVLDAGTIGSPTITRTSEPFSGKTDSTLFDLHEDKFKGVYIKEHDEIWFGWSNSGLTYNFGIIAINASTGAETYFSDFVIDGYIPATHAYPSASGFPIFNYDPIARRIWWQTSFLSGANAVAYIQVDTKQQIWYPDDGQTGAWTIGYPNRNSYWSGWIDGNTFKMREVRLGQISQGTIAISEIIADICDRMGYEATEYDVSALTNDFIGSFIHGTRHKARQDVELLLGVALADGVQSDYKLKFVKRGGTIAKTIPNDDLGTQELKGEINPVEPVQILMPMDFEVPKVYEVTYRSIENIYQSGIARSYIATADSQIPQTTQLPMALTTQQAFDIAETYHQQLFEPKVFKFNLPIKYSYLEPTDVLEIPKNNRNYRVRLVKIERGTNWILNCEAIIDKSENYITSAAIPGVDDFLGNIITEIRPIKLILDGPLLRDIDDDHPGPYLTSYSNASTYSGAVWYYSFDDSNWFELFPQDSQSAAGFCNVAYNTEIWEAWDDTTTLTVTVTNGGSFSSSTKSAIEADPTINSIAYGRKGRWEYLNFATATLISTTPRQYELTNLLRGRRGTDNHINIHEAKDYLVKLDYSGIKRQILQNSQIGNQIYYRLPNLSEAVSEVLSEVDTVDGQPLKPYSPIQVEGTLVASDVEFNWTRRTRKGGSLGGDNTLTDGVGGPLNEESEEYELDIVTVSTGDVLRTETGLNTNFYDYTSAKQTTDGTDLLGRFYADVYQISAVVGRGFRGRGLYDRGWTDLINEGIDLGAKVIFSLDDSDTSNAKEWVTGNTTAGTYTSAAQTTALVTDNAAQSFDGDGSGYMKCGTIIRDATTGKNKISFVWLMRGETATSGRRYISCTQGGATNRFRVNESSTSAITINIAPKSGGSSVSATITPGTEKKSGICWMGGFTVDLDGTFRINKYANGEYLGDTTYGTGNAAYASTFQTETRDTAYNDTVNAATDNTPTLILDGSSTGFLMVFDKVLNPSDYAKLWETVSSEINEVYSDTDCQTACALEDTAPTVVGTEYTTLKGTPWLYGSASTSSSSLCVGCDLSAYLISTSWLYNSLPTLWKVQTFSIELTFKPQTIPSGTQWLLSLAPKDWNGTNKRGFHILHDATTNGLIVRIGTNGATFTDYSDGTPTLTSTSTTYHIVITVDATNGIKGYVNNTEVLTSGGDTTDIQWADGTSGWPDIASSYLCAYNDGAIQTSPNNITSGLIGYINRFSFWTKELSSAEVTDLYKRNLGIA